MEPYLCFYFNYLLKFHYLTVLLSGASVLGVPPNTASVAPSIVDRPPLSSTSWWSFFPTTRNELHLVESTEDFLLRTNSMEGKLSEIGKLLYHCPNRRS
jgi:hypothetical protein